MHALTIRLASLIVATARAAIASTWSGYDRLNEAAVVAVGRVPDDDYIVGPSSHLQIILAALVRSFSNDIERSSVLGEDFSVRPYGTLDVNHSACIGGADRRSRRWWKW